MVRNRRSAPRRPVNCAMLAPFFGLAFALCAIATPPGRLSAQVDDSRSMFDILDENRDGVVTREEFLRMKTEIFYRALKDLDRDQSLGPEDIHITPQAFADADLNGDGRISGAEFVQAPFTQFEAIDANGDQKITFEEFRDFRQQYRL
jgi:Ca2+-binding EF-hand superfamily protein